jgi:hypothetical protein
MGHFRGLFQINQGWLFIFLTFALVVLTCLQARGSLLTRGIPLINQSRGNSLFFLRAISELAGLSLSATISAMLERLKWTLVCRNNQPSRARLVDFLALDEGTKIMALLSLAGGATMPSAATRLWSIARLLLIAIVPITGILIMSSFTSLKRSYLQLELEWKDDHDSFH